MTFSVYIYIMIKNKILHIKLFKTYVKNILNFHVTFSILNIKKHVFIELF